MDQTTPYDHCKTQDEFMEELNVQMQLWKHDGKSRHQCLRGFAEYINAYRRIQQAAAIVATPMTPDDAQFHMILTRVKEAWVHGRAPDQKTAFVYLHKIIFPVSGWTYLGYTDEQLNRLTPAVSDYLEKIKLSTSAATPVVERLDMAKTFSNSPRRATNTQMAQSIDTMLGAISGVPTDLGRAKTVPHSGARAIEHVLGQDALDAVEGALMFVEDGPDAELQAALLASMNSFHMEEQDDEQMQEVLLASMLADDDEMDMFPASH